MKLRLTMLVAACLALGVSPLSPIAHASDSGGVAGHFEIDGNTLDDSGPGDPLDWDTATVPPMLDRVTFDDPNAADGEVDDVFAANSKENTPDEWQFKDGSVPQKSDIDQADLAARFVDGELWLYAAASRSATNGAMNLSLEFGQDSGTFINSKGQEVPIRTTGDLMIMVLVTQGGQVNDLVLYMWAGTKEFGQWSEVEAAGDWLATTNHGQDGLSKNHWNFVEAAINLTSFGIGVDCGGFGEAWIKTNSTTGQSPDGVFKDDGVLKDRTERKSFNLGTDLDDAATSGDAHGLHASLAGTSLLDEVHSSTSQAGVAGGDGPVDANLVQTPAELADVASATLVATSSESALSGNRGESSASAQTADVDLLGGIIQADAVRAEANAVATGRTASVSAAGSNVERVLVDDDANPLTPPVEVEGSDLNVRVDLEPTVFGPNSYVAVLEVTPAATTQTSKPPADQLSGGFYSSTITVRGIHVHITGGIIPAADVVVSEASANATFPQSFACTIPQHVSGSAFVLSEQTAPEVAPALQGFVQIPPATGGEAGQQVLSIDAPGVVTAGVGTSHSKGEVDPDANTSTSASFAEVADICLFPAPDGTCAFAAQAIRADAHAFADGSDATSGGAVTILDLDGEVIPTAPDDGPEIEIPGVARIFLNVQTAADDPAGANSTEITVTAIVIELLDPASAGAEIRIAEAHADAYAPADA